MPQPYFVPVSPSESRNTHSNGVAGFTSAAVSCLPLTFRVIMNTDYTEFTDLSVKSLFRVLRLCYEVAFRVVDSHLAKRRDLILHLIPVADDHDRGALRVEVLRCGFLNVCRRQPFVLRTEVVDDVLVEIVGVDRGDASGEALLTREL